MVSALRGMIEERHKLTVEATVNKKKWLFEPICRLLRVHTMQGFRSVLPYLRSEHSSEELNVCNSESEQFLSVFGNLVNVQYRCSLALLCVKNLNSALEE